MKLSEMCEKYYFHDSGFEKITYDELKQTATVEIDFCNWAQDYYKADMSENAVMTLTFDKVKKIEGLDVFLDSNSIARCAFISGGVEFLLFRDYVGGDKGVDVIKIFANSVEIRRLTPGK